MILLDETKWREFCEQESVDLDPDELYDNGYEDAMDNVDDWIITQPQMATPTIICCGQCVHSFGITGLDGERKLSCTEIGRRGLKDTDFCSYGKPAYT